MSICLLDTAPLVFYEMSAIQVEKIVHINQLLKDFDGANEFYRDVFAAREYMRNYFEGEQRDASLFLIGDTCIELFSPRTDTSALGRQLARFGDSWHSFEWKVPDLAAAKEVLESRGIRIATYMENGFLMTHPRDTYGMVLELCPLEMQGDLRLLPDWSPDYWRDEHPLGISGLNCMSSAVADLDETLAFFVEVFGAQPCYEVDRPAIKGRAAGLRFPDHVLELVQPTDDTGSVAAYIARYGPRLRTIVFRVTDLEAATRYLHDKGVRTVTGDFHGSMAIDPQDNFGVLWQFTEQPVPAG
jgi:catechol 2,3-dioxygenase-like lactoylglutathione lyase family enzyme